MEDSTSISLILPESSAKDIEVAEFSEADVAVATVCVKYYWRHKQGVPECVRIARAVGREEEGWKLEAEKFIRAQRGRKGELRVG